MRKRFVFKGSYTVEASFLLPMILMVIVAIIYLSFYFHDRAVLSSSAYTCALRGSQMLNGEDVFAQVQFCSRELIEDRLLATENLSTDIEISKDKIVVDYSGEINMPFRKLSINAHGQALVQDAIGFIRTCRVIEKAVKE